MELVPCGMAFSRVILVTSRLNKSGGLADSLKQSAAAADLMKQHPARSKGLCPAEQVVFQPD
jgi:hypothetical protein